MYSIVIIKEPFQAPQVFHKETKEIATAFFIAVCRELFDIEEISDKELVDSESVCFSWSESVYFSWGDKNTTVWFVKNQ